MLEALKSYKVYLVGLILTLVGFIPMFVAIGMFNNGSEFKNYAYLELAVCAVFLIIGYMWGDHNTAYYQRNNKSLDGEIPGGVFVRSWELRLYFFIPVLIIGLTTLGIFIYHWITGTFPFNLPPVVEALI